MLGFWLWHPLSGNGEGFYGGIGGDAGIIGAVLAVIWGDYRRRACHVDHCWRLGHLDPALGHPACRHHHSLRDRVGQDPHA